MQGACSAGGENEKARTKYMYVQLSNSGETVLDEVQRKGDVDALLVW